MQDLAQSGACPRVCTGQVTSCTGCQSVAEHILAYTHMLVLLHDALIQFGLIRIIGLKCLLYNVVKYYSINLAHVHGGKPCAAERLMTAIK